MDMFQSSNYDILCCHIYKKPSQFSGLQYKHYIIHDEVQKGESDSPIHISADEQISIHFGKASIQDERTCILKLEARGNNSINRKERLSKLEEGTQTFIFVIEITLQLGGSIENIIFVIVQIGQMLSYSESGLRFLTDNGFPL
jgi:hypothetical protein